MNLNEIRSLSHTDFDFSEIKEIKNIKSGICFDTYEITNDNTNFILKAARNKTQIENIRKLKLEFDIQKDLYSYFPVPKQILFFKDYSQIVYPFYISEKINGESKKNISSVKKSFDLLLELHKISLDIVSKKNIKVEKNLKNIIDKNYSIYVDNKKQKNNSLEKLYSWLISNIPDKGSLCLTHNDWRSDNIIFQGDKIGAVIDWELCSISHAGLDVGTAMSYLKTEEEEEILNYLNTDFDEYNFFKIFGILKLFAIIEAGVNNKINDIINNEEINNFLESKMEEGLRIIKNGN